MVAFIALGITDPFKELFISSASALEDSFVQHVDSNIIAVIITTALVIIMSLGVFTPKLSTCLVISLMVPQAIRSIISTFSVEAKSSELTTMDEFYKLITKLLEDTSINMMGTMIGIFTICIMLACSFKYIHILLYIIIADLYYINVAASLASEAYVSANAFFGILSAVLFGACFWRFKEFRKFTISIIFAVIGNLGLLWAYALSDESYVKMPGEILEDVLGLDIYSMKPSSFFFMGFVSMSVFLQYTLLAIFTKRVQAITDVKRLLMAKSLSFQ